MRVDQIVAATLIFWQRFLFELYDQVGGAGTKRLVSLFLKDELGRLREARKDADLEAI